jgi:hypothetical protein
MTQINSDKWQFIFRARSALIDRKIMLDSNTQKLIKISATKHRPFVSAFGKMTKMKNVCAILKKIHMQIRGERERINKKESR